MNVIRLLKQTTVEDGAAVLMVTHDHRVISSADRLVHMVDGRIMSDVVLHDACGSVSSSGRSRGSLPMSRKRCRNVITPPARRSSARAIPERSSSWFPTGGVGVSRAVETLRV